MNLRTPHSILIALALAPAATFAAEPVGDAFTYQGKLSDNNSPANGIYDFSFTLHDVAAGAGALSMDPVQAHDVPVENGVFSVQLDFGSGVFVGDKRWLQIAVREGASSGAYETLQGRQELTAAPYALYALNGNPGPPGQDGVVSVSSFSGLISGIPSGNPNWIFAGPTTTLSITAGQRVTASATGTLATFTGSSVDVSVGMCWRAAGGGTVFNFNGTDAVISRIVVGEYTQVSADASLAMASTGSIVVGLCVLNTSPTILGANQSMNGWAMVTN